jgi:hypothetical protein
MYAFHEDQLRQSPGASGWALTPDQIAKLDRASEVQKVYPFPSG